jgi:mannose-1-phosphate guanylyltransferase
MVKHQAFTADTRFCIVIANEERPERLTGNLRNTLNSQQANAVKKKLLRQASLRARCTASPSRVLLSAQEKDRPVWEGPLWFTRPSNRFLSDPGVPTSFSTAAAVLSVAARLPSCLVTILPSDFWVANEVILAQAIERVLKSLKRTPGMVATLGMSDTHPGTDEDYLIVGPESSAMGAAIQARASRPIPAIAKQLSKEGALVASGILLGQAQAFAERIHKYWPNLVQELTGALDLDRFDEVEHRLSADAFNHISRSLMSSIRLSPPTFPMRAFRVQGSGWCSRKPSDRVPPEAAIGRRANAHRRNRDSTDHPTESS